MFTELRIPAGRRPMTPSEMRTAAIAGTIIAAMILFAVFEEFSAARLSLLFIMLWWAPMLVLHELGHAVVAHLLGWRVREIVIGFGRDLVKWQIGETRVRIKIAPLEGYVLPAPSDRGGIRLKSALIYAAGPGAELLLLGLLIMWFGWDTVFSESDSLSLVALKSLAIVILLGAGFNLLPFTSEGAVSDGLGIISSPFMPESVIQLRLATFELREIARHLDEGDPERALSLAEALQDRFPDNEHLQLIRVACLSAAGETDQAREIAKLKLATSDSDPAQRLAWLESQARIELDAQEPSWLVLDLAVQEALQSTPNSASMRAIKGASHVLRGHYEAGGDLLADAWRRGAGSASYDAEMLAYMTIAAHKTGHADATRHFRNAFESANKSTRLASRVAKYCGTHDD